LAHSVLPTGQQDGPTGHLKRLFINFKEIKYLKAAPSGAAFFKYWYGPIECILKIAIFKVPKRQDIYTTIEP